MTATEWLNRGISSNDEFDAFSNYWKGFNHLFFQVSEGTERKKIKKFIQENITKQIAFKILSTCETQIDLLIQTPVMDMRQNGRDTSEYMASFLASNQSVEKLKELFMIIYQVRCNLEHGQKSPTDQRDKTLTKAANSIIKKVIETKA